MHVLSPDIARAVDIARSAGNDVADVSEGWSAVRQVVSMRDYMVPGLREAISAALPSLRYWRAEGTPHNAPSEGFQDDALQVGLSFPWEQKPRWAL